MKIAAYLGFGSQLSLSGGRKSKLLNSNSTIEISVIEFSQKVKHYWILWLNFS